MQAAEDMGFLRKDEKTGEMIGHSRGIRPVMLWNPFVARITRELHQDHDHSSAVLTVLQGGPTPERPRTRP
jgi:hypothetical protein